MERHHCRFLHWWCSCCPWWLQGHAQRCHRLRHPARRHRGRGYRFPAHDGREHQTRHASSTSPRHRGWCRQAHRRLKKEIKTTTKNTCVIYGYIRRLERKALFWGCPFSLDPTHDTAAPRWVTFSRLLFTLRNHVLCRTVERTTVLVKLVFV